MLGFLILLTVPAVLAGGRSVDYTEFQIRCSEIAGDRAAIAVMDLKSGYLIAATDKDLLFSKRFPPGSVAKLLTALAALDEGKIPKDSFFCTGIEVSGRDTLRCSMRDGHGWVDFDHALVESCNLYFQNLSKSLTAEELAGLPRNLRLSGKVGVDLPGEVESIIQIPSSDSALREFAIGQGAAIQLTPVAMLALISGIATNGSLIKPRLSQGSAIRLSTLPDQKALARVRPLLRDVVRRGTGKSADITSVTVAGKTGTSTVLGSWVTQGWFVGFAPYTEPKIALVVFLKRGEGKDAAQLAGLVFSSYFGGGYADR